MKTKLYILLIFVGLHSFVLGQKTVSFRAVDNLTINADYYETFAESNKYMLMFHQAEYSRGEYQQIAERMIKLDFNCLAVDLRYGKEVNYVNNETAEQARQNKMNVTLLSCEKDIEAAINYIQTNDPSALIFLMGSSFSASLCLKVAKDRDDIQAVVHGSEHRAFVDRSHEFASADISTNFGDKYGLKYYNDGAASAFSVEKVWM